MPVASLNISQPSQQVCQRTVIIQVTLIIQWDNMLIVQPHNISIMLDKCQNSLVKVVGKIHMKETIRMIQHAHLKSTTMVGEATQNLNHYIITVDLDSAITVTGASSSIDVLLQLLFSEHLHT